MHVTLQDVARRANVSAKTVSRVVNNQGEISALTRQRVQEAILELGYHPNYLARGLARKASNTLAVVAAGLNFYGPSHTLTGIEQQSCEFGYSLLFNLLAQPEDIDVKAILDTIVAHRADGIIWAVPEIDDNRAWIQPKLMEHLPPVVFISMKDMPGLSIVSVDNYGGGFKATRHLIEQGRRHIGVITGPSTWWEARQRLGGYYAALQEAGIETRDSLMVEGDWTAASGQKCMRELLSRNSEIDAVFACNDQMALGAMGVAHQAGKRIPQDLAFVGFDAIPDSECFWPALTTVRQRLMDAGCLSVKMLQKLITSRAADLQSGVPERILLDTELIVRASTLAGSA
jgi:LacI family transcriptional regulator